MSRKIFRPSGAILFDLRQQGEFKKRALKYGIRDLSSGQTVTLSVAAYIAGCSTRTLRMANFGGRLPVIMADYCILVNIHDLWVWARFYRHLGGMLSV